MIRASLYCTLVKQTGHDTTELCQLLTAALVGHPRHYLASTCLKLLLPGAALSAAITLRTLLQDTLCSALDACPLDSAFKKVLACVHQRLMELNKTSALDPIDGLSPVRLLPRLGIIFLPCRALLLQEGGTQALPLECLASSALALATSSS